MFKLFRWFLGFLVTIAMLMVAAIVVVPMVFDPNDYREEITEIVRDQTGRELKLDGDLKLSFIPWIGIRTQQLSLSQPVRIGGDMISVDQAQLRVKLAPLINKRVEVDTIVLDRPRIRLVTLADGTDSFYGLLETEGMGEKQATEIDAQPVNPATVGVAIAVQGVQINDAEITIEDRTVDSLTRLTNLDLSTGNLLGSEFEQLSLSGVLLDEQEITFNVDGLARIDAERLNAQAKEIRIELTVRSEKGNEVATEVATQIDIDSLEFDQQSLLSVSNFKAQVTQPVRATADGSSLRVDLDTQQLNLDAFRLVMASASAELNNVAVSQFIDKPAVKAKLTIPEFDATYLLTELDVPYRPQDTSVLKKVGLNANLEAGLNAVAISDLKFVLDESELLGGFSINDFANPQTQFDLQLDELNLDRYLPVDDASEKSEQTVQSSDALVVPMAVFKELNANGQFRAKNLVSGGVALNDIDVQVRSTNNGIKIVPTASLYDGSLGGEIAFSDEQGTSELKVKNEIDLVQLGQLLTDAQVSDQLSGIGSLLVDLVVQEKDGVQTNNGVITLQAKNGAIQGVDIKGAIDGAYSYYQAYKGRNQAVEDGAQETTQSGKASSDDQTRFAELFGTFNVNNNIVTNNDFTLKAPLFRVGGQGTIDIEKQTLDYLVEVKVVASTDGQGGEAIDKLKGIPIPIRFSGSLNSPSYSIDMKRMFKELFAADLNRKKAELLKEKVGIEGAEELSTKELLKGLLGREIDKKLNRADADSEKQSNERPISERQDDSDQQEAEQPKQPAPVSDDDIPDVPATPIDSKGEVDEADDRSEKEKAEDQLKEDLKKKLLDSIFG